LQNAMLKMAEYELFKILNLRFDPPERASKKVHEAIEVKRKIINDELAAGGTQPIRRDELNAMLNFLEEIERIIFTKDDKLTDEFTKLAHKRVDKEMAGLRATVALMQKSGTHAVTAGTINTQKERTLLSKENIEQVYVSAGIEIKPIKRLKDFLSFPTNVDRLYKDIQALRKEKPLNGVDLSIITDLYSFAAFLCNDSENSVLYRNKTTPELQVLFAGFARKFNGSGDNYFHLCSEIVALVNTNVVISDVFRRAYDDFLLYKTPKLVELFEIMKEAPKQNKLDSKYAEICIKTISEVFGNYDIALAIYNKEAGLEDDPYTPEKIRFYVLCSHCQTLLEFADINEAQNISKCKHCLNSLFKQCKNCKKNVLASQDKCPECGFIFVSTAMFARYFAEAEQALHRNDFEKARTYLLQAQSADPSEKTKTAQLEARITAEEKKYEKPVNDLRMLIADKKYQKASDTLSDIIGEFPGLNVSDFDSQIEAALKSAKTAFTGTKKLSPSKQADSCLEILHECADFKPAIDFLRATPPEACKSFSIGMDSLKCYANLSWSRSAEQGITYRVIRKQGKEIPINEMDGEILLDNTIETSFRDKSILSGRYYSYAAFAIRYGVFSSATGKTVVISADVTDAHCEQFGTTIRITWNNPINCIGVTIKRIANGSTTMLNDNANGSFEDRGIEYGVAYSYNLCAKYNGLPQSNGVDVVITPMIKVESFSIKAERLNGNNYKISWDIEHNGIDVRILVDEKLVRELKSGVHCCNIALLPDGFHTVTVLAYSGGAWLHSSNSPQINTYSPCSIDKLVSQPREDTIDGLRVTIPLKICNPVPKNVVGFYYAVRTKSAVNEKAPWAEKQEIGSAFDIHRVSLSTYQKSGEITYIETAREEDCYYISLFTIYNFNSQEIVSNASLCRIDRPLIATLFWKVNKSRLSGLKLTIEITTNRPFERIPELVLCACNDGQHLLSPSDAQGRCLKVLPESRTNKPQRTFMAAYDIGSNSSAEQLKGMKLFLFEVNAVPKENFALRWADRFIGKI